MEGKSPALLLLSEVIAAAATAATRYAIMPAIMPLRKKSIKIKEEKKPRNKELNGGLNILIIVKQKEKDLFILDNLVEFLYFCTKKDWIIKGKTL